MTKVLKHNILAWHIQLTITVNSPLVLDRYSSRPKSEPYSGLLCSCLMTLVASIKDPILKSWAEYIRNRFLTGFPCEISVAACTKSLRITPENIAIINQSNFYDYSYPTLAINMSKFLGYCYKIKLFFIVLVINDVEKLYYYSFTLLWG